MGKIAVLGLGESLKLYDYVMDEFMCTIGVNDIWRYHKTDYVVCLDEPERFTEDRLKYINSCKPKRFYTQVGSWADRADFWPIELQVDYPNYICQLDIKALPKSMCSPFVAAAIAYKYHGAKEIHLYGVDLTTHPHLHANTVDRIVKHFGTLKTALTQAGCKLVVHGDGRLRSL